MAKRSFHELMNPFRWAKRQIDYAPDMCKKTLDILARTCRVSIGSQYPLPLMRLRARMLLNAAS